MLTSLYKTRSLHTDGERERERERERGMEGIRPHLLLLAYPAQGHVNPQMQLGKRLAALGVRVTLATMQHHYDRIMRAQLALPQPMSESHPDFQLVSLPDDLPPGYDRDTWTDEVMRVVDETLEEGAMAVIEELSAQGRPVTCIVGDFFLRWTPSLARRTNLPEFVLWPQCASVFSIYAHLDNIISAGYDPFESNVRATTNRENGMHLLSCIPGLPKIHPADLPFESVFGKEGLAWLQGAVQIRFNNISQSKGILINSFKSLEVEVCRTLQEKVKQHIPRIYMVGPLVTLSFLKEEDRSQLGGGKANLMSGASLWEEQVEECMEWLDKQPTGSVVLVAFGSLTMLSVAQVRELATGLAASRQRLLWVIRKDCIKAMEEDTEGTYWQELKGSADVELEEALPSGFLERNKERCKVVGWAPQAMVLSHRAVGGFFSHCGWNSTLESICAGVPLLGWPWLADQVTNCWLASHVWKIGLTLLRNEENQASSKDIEDGVRALMQGQKANEMRTRAKELSELARQATLDLNVVTNPLLSFISSLSS